MLLLLLVLLLLLLLVVVGAVVVRVAVCTNSGIQDRGDSDSIQIDVTGGKR